MREEKFAVVDVETTGLNIRRDRVISIAIVPMDGLKIEMNRVFTAILKPEGVEKIDVSSAKYHGILPKDIITAPNFCHILEDVEILLDDRVIVGHGVRIDIDFLNKEFKNCGKKFQNEKSIDIAVLEKVIGEILGEKIGNEDLVLEKLAKKYNIDVVYRHNALADAIIEAQIFQIQVMRLLKYGINTYEKLQTLIKRVGFDSGMPIF